MGKIVFTNGCFDLFHAGHLSTLVYCRKLAGAQGLVIAAINSDDSVSRIKGSGRPIINEIQRYAILDSNKFVDEVYIFMEDTPYELIKFLHPDIIVKGPDYAGKESEVVGADIAEVKILPDVYCSETISTSSIITKIRNLHD